MGSRKVKAPAQEATPIAAQAKEVDTEQANVAMEDQARRRKGISAMYNRFGADVAGGKRTLGS